MQNCLKKFILSISLCCVAFLAEASIVETHNMSELYDHLSPKTLIIFDIDNTIITTTQELGSDQWFYHQQYVYQKHGMDKKAAFTKTLAEWTAIQHITKSQLVEEVTPGIIQELQNKGYIVMGLTTRSLNLSTCTTQQLSEFDVDLTKTAPTKTEVFVQNGQGVLFYGGILFTAGTHKGNALDRFLDAIGFKPESIVFINDKATHLKPVEEFCDKNSIPFVGLRYGFLDSRVKNFNPKIADVQHSHFGKILSDDDAARLIESAQLEYLRNIE